MKRLILGALLLGCGLLTSCGDRKDQEGVFLDSAVQGLRYVTDSFEGFTDANGTFSYRSGETVQFYLGQLVLGSAAGAPQITPLDLVEDATEVTNNRVTNIARLLQTLDENSNLEDGISLLPSVNTANGTQLNLDLSIVAFGSDINVATFVNEVMGVPVALVDATQAQEHLKETIDGFTVPSLTVNAGDDQTVRAGDTVTLTGVLTGEDLGFRWERDAGSQGIELIFGNTSTTDDVENTQIQFTAPNVSEPTDYRFTFIGRKTNNTLVQDTVTVTVNP